MGNIMRVFLQHKSLNLFCFIMVLSISILMPTKSWANLSLDKVILHFKPTERPVQNITVTNQSDKIVKVSGKVLKITNSGQPTESELDTQELVIAPKSFELPPNESRVVRLVLRKFPDNSEGIYRIRFRPDKPEVSEQQFEGGTSVRIGVITTMGALAIVAPKNPAPNLIVERRAETLFFKNEGNVTAQLQREDFCNKSRTVCSTLTGKRIYPGMSWSIDVPEVLKGQAFSQTILTNGQYSTLPYPAP